MTPPKLEKVRFEDERIILKFDKALNASAARKKNKYVFSGKIEILNSDSTDKQEFKKLTKKPKFVYAFNKNEVEISFPYKHTLKDMDSLKVKNNIIDFGTFTLQINNLLDQDGNKFGESKILPFQQFREFYVNKVDSVSQPQYSKNKRLSLTIPLYNHYPENTDKFWDHYNYPIIKSITGEDLKP